MGVQYNEEANAAVNPFEDMQAGRRNCPSEETLDRLHWGEIAPDHAVGLQAHLQACADCRRRMELRRKGFAAFEEFDASRLRARILDAAGGSLARPSMARLWLLPAAAVACALLLVVAASGLVDQQPAVRTKGTLQLQVFRERGGRVDRPFSSDAFYPGDRLRFGTNLPRNGHVMIVGAEQNGKLYLCFPADGSRTSRQRPAGRAQHLPGAVRLDASTGMETLYLIVCPRPFSFDELATTGTAGGLVSPRGCRTSRFLMNKTKP